MPVELLTTTVNCQPEEADNIETGEWCNRITFRKYLQPGMSLALFQSGLSGSHTWQEEPMWPQPGGYITSLFVTRFTFLLSNDKPALSKAGEILYILYFSSVHCNRTFDVTGNLHNTETIIVILVVFLCKLLFNSLTYWFSPWELSVT